MKKKKSVAVVLMVITATLLGLTACNNHCKEGCEKNQAAAKKDDCSGHCTKEENCCNKCSSGEKHLAKKTPLHVVKMKKEKCCKEDADNQQKHRREICVSYA